MASKNPFKAWRSRHPDISLRVLADHLGTTERHVCGWQACSASQGTLPSARRRVDIADVTFRLTGDQVPEESWASLEAVRKKREQSRRRITRRRRAAMRSR